MRMLIIIVVICVLSRVTDAVWYRDLTSPRGLQLGNMVVRFEDSKAENRTFEDRIALRVDYGDFGVSASQTKENNGVELSFLMNEKVEGRGKKMEMGTLMVPFMIGAVKATVITVALGALKILATKALIISKFALATLLFVLLSKYWKKSSQVEVEQVGAQYNMPMYDFSSPAYANMNNLFDNYAYVGSYPQSAAETSLNYAIVTPGSNASSNALQMMMDNPHFVPVATKRHDIVKPKPSPMILTLKRYAYPKET